MWSILCSAVGSGSDAVWSLQFDMDRVDPVEANDRGWWLGKALTKQKAGTEKWRLCGCVTQMLLLSHSSLLLYTEMASVCCLDADEMRASLEPACSLLARFLACWRL